MKSLHGLLLFVNSQALVRSTGAYQTFRMFWFIIIIYLIVGAYIVAWRDVDIVVEAIHEAAWERRNRPPKTWEITLLIIFFILAWPYYL